MFSFSFPTQKLYCLHRIRFGDRFRSMGRDLGHRPDKYTAKQRLHSDAGTVLPELSHSTDRHDTNLQRLSFNDPALWQSHLLFNLQQRWKEVLADPSQGWPDEKRPYSPHPILASTPSKQEESRCWSPKPLPRPGPQNKP